MAKKYDGPINRHVNPDFTHAGPNGEPASGLAVQKYIRDSIDAKKFGAAYVDNNGFCLFFADEIDMATYKADPTRTDLIRERIELGGEPMYKINVSISEPLNNYAAVFYGSNGNYIRYTFQTIDRDEQVFLEPVNATYTIQNGSTVNTIRESYHAGASVAFNVDKYLLEGNNDITIVLKGQISGVEKTVGVRFQAINIYIRDNFDISSIYSNGDVLTVSGTVGGSGTRSFEWYLDGVQLLPPTEEDTIISVGDASFTKHITLTGLTSGRHNIQYRAYISVEGGGRFYSNVMYRDFVVDDEQLDGVTILTKFESPRDIGIIDAFTQPIPMNGPVQYEIFHVGYAIYSKTNKPNETLSILFGGQIGGKLDTVTVHNGTMYEYSIREFSSGQTPLTFSCRETTLAYNAIVSASSYNLNPISDTQFEFSGSDKTNDSKNKDKWSFKGYTGTLTGFDWTESSGWVGNRLIVPAGARFDVTNYAPFENNVKRDGFTFEIEFSTTRVLDESTPIIDLRNNGRGLLITASEIMFSSRGASVNTKYKPDENVRAAIVITPTTGDYYPGFIFIYIDGVLTGATTYASTDSFDSSQTLSIIGSNDAIVSVKQIRTYTKALTSDNVLDNYILYRDSVEELVNAYDRNDIYIQGSKHISQDKLAAQTPIIIITGNVNKLQGFDKKNKSTYVKMDKIEVINMADQTKNMTLINPSMRCQGTSSMEYPRKNFRFYTQADSEDKTVPSYTTQMFDYLGNELTGDARVYAFRDNAQAVNCWCLKADYAESSSTHNTGVARMWNQYMKFASIDKEEIDSRFYLKDIFPKSNTPCRTIAQHLAENNASYNYDVRTTVDGFPITLFFREHEGDPLTFLGRYNWNNDKSTESVFGFKDIPGFDPYKNTMECWEVVNGDKPCNLFTDLSHWNNGKGMTGGWYDSFESRYPNDHNKPSEAERATGANSELKRVATWINSTMGASKVQDGHMVVDNPALMARFKTGDPNAEVGEGRNGKWDFLDVYKVAAYYVYLMRYGAVDQTVKNAMFTTEDGKHWYYINYDNDTINGVENSGKLTLGYDIDRQSPVPGTPGSYCYAGHSSVLWNNLEADDEFMAIVKKVDNALFKAGMSYQNVINMFNIEQSAKWSERTHNEDYAYKYLDISDRTQLSKLQGPRKSHRQWWLSHRFSIYDAIFGTESYIENRISIKPVTSTDNRTGQYVTVTPAVNNQIFGYGYENPVLTGVHGVKDVPIQFDMVEDYYEGTTIKFFNAAYFKEINASKISKYVKEVYFTQANTAAFDSQLTSLILGDMSSEDNTNMTKIENLYQLKYLENLQICNYKGFGSIDLRGNKYLKTLDFRNCTSLATIELPTAAPITSIKYPYSISAIDLKELTSLSNVEIQLDGNNKQFVYDINIKNCPQMTNSPTFILNWLDNRDSSIDDSECHVTMDNVVWENISMENLMRIAQLAENAGFGDNGNIKLYGHASVANIDDPDDAQYLMSVFGDSVFDKTSAFYIDAPKMVFFNGPDVVLEGRSEQYEGIVIGGEEDGRLYYQIVSTVTHGASFNSTGLLSTIENGDPTTQTTLQLTYIEQSTGTVRQIQKVISIAKRTYPSSISISGDTSLEEGVQRTYGLSYSGTYNGEMLTSWQVSGDIVPYISINTTGDNECVIALETVPDIDVVSGTLTATIVKKYAPEQQVVNPISISIGYQDESIAISRFSNPYALDVLIANNLMHPEFGDTNDKMTITSATLISNSDISSGSSSYSTIFNINANFRNNCTSFNEFKYFTSIIEVPANAFNGCSKLTSIEFGKNVANVGSGAFGGCSKLERICFHGSVALANTCLNGASNAKEFEFGGITSITGNPYTLSSNKLEKIIIRVSNDKACNVNGVDSLMVWLKASTATQKELRFIGNGGDISTAGGTNVASGSFPLTGLNGPTVFEGTFGNVVFGTKSFYRCNFASFDFPDANSISIGISAFEASSLQSISIPDSVIAIGDYSFRECRNLSGIINIPDGVTGLGREAFRNDKISGVIIGKGLTDYKNYGASGGTSIDGAFVDNPLETIVVDSENPYLNDDNGNNCIILTSDGSLRLGCSQTVITSSVSSIYHYAFSGNSAVTSVSVPSSVSGVGMYAFSQCQNLQAVSYSAPQVSAGCFYSCPSLTGVTLSNNVTGIQNRAFQQCTSLQSIVLPDSVTSLGSSTFSGCTSLQDVTFSNNLTSVGSGCFGSCNLQSITLPASITSIGTGAFNGNTELTTAVINSHITALEKSVFGNCASLSSVTLPNTLLSLEGNTNESGPFHNCTSLTSITLPDSLTTINYEAFDNAGLTSINIPRNVTSINVDAFKKCPLEVMTVDLNNTTYKDNGCNGIITIQNNSLVIGCKTTLIDNTKYNYIASRAFSYVDFGNREIIIDSNAVSLMGAQWFNYCKIDKLTVNDWKPVAYTSSRLTGSGNKIREVCWNSTQPSSETAYDGNGCLTGISTERFIATALPTSDPVSPLHVIGPNVNVTNYFEFPDNVQQIASTTYLLSGKNMTIVSHVTVPPTIGNLLTKYGATIQHIYVPASSVADYQSASNWSEFASVIEAIPNS